MSTNFDTIRESLDAYERAVQQHRFEVGVREMGSIASIHRGVVQVHGLADVTNNELLRFSDDKYGWVFNLDRDSVGCVLLDHHNDLKVGQQVRRTYRTLDIPVGDELLGRVIDPVGRPLDRRGRIDTTERLPVERSAPAVLDRAPVNQPLQTGIKVIDALVPIGRGQRQLIIGDRQTGKSSVAVETVLNQQDTDVICIYCAIGQRNSAVTNVIHQLNRSGAINDCVVVVGQSQATAGLQFIAPYAAMSIGEFFMQQGRNVLVIFDDLTAHAKAFREMSLLLRRSPGREAYPGDVFYIHARLLERSTCLCPELGGGSLTALPIVETESQNVSAYIPTNLISITDGQIYMSHARFQKGILPAVDVGRSVSRVGGKAQLKAYRRITGPLRLAYAQFEELNKFARFTSQLDETTKQKLTRGHRVQEVLRQDLQDARNVADQIITFVCLTQGLFDNVPLPQIKNLENEFCDTVKQQVPSLYTKIQSGHDLSSDEIATIVKNCSEHLEFQES